MNGRRSRQIRADLTENEKADVEDLIRKVGQFRWSTGRPDKIFVVPFVVELTTQLATSQWREVSCGPGKKEGSLRRLEKWCHPIRRPDWTARERHVTPRARWISYLLFGTVVAREDHHGCNACPAYTTDQLPPWDIDGLRAKYPTAP